MNSLYNYIKHFENKQKSYLKLNAKDKEYLLELDNEFKDLIYRVRSEYNEKDIINLDEEFDKFMEARNKGKKYYPLLKTSKCKYKESNIISDLIELKNKFNNFKQCFLSKYYIEVINRKIRWCKYVIDICNGDYKEWPSNVPDRKLFEEALHVFKTNKYQSSNDLNRNIDSENAKKMIEDALKELNYDWKVSIEDNMLARMNVLPNKIIRISKTAKFNEADIEGLIAHEIKGHIGRRYWGYKTGLNLFVYGLEYCPTLDEGLAVWNSINLVKHEKPNVMVNISLKYIIGYLKHYLDFCELFDYIKKISKKHNIPDSVIFKAIIRSKRDILNMKIMGGKSDDCDYFLGYNIVNNMTEKQREDILKYNIGPSHLNDLNDIKKFLKINNFKSL